MDETIKVPINIKWGLFHLIEAIARSLEINDFSIDIRPSVERIEYNPENKTIKIKGDTINIETLAHELYHHYQDINGLLPKDGSPEKTEYVAYRYKLHMHYDPNFSWAYLTFPWEAQAEAFSRVFTEHYLRYINKMAILSEEDLPEALDEVAEIGVPVKYLPRHHKFVEQFKRDFEKIYVAFSSKYGDNIDIALETTLSVIDNYKNYSFNIIREEKTV